MTYTLVPLDQNRPPRELDGDEAKILKRAMRSVMHALAVEENYNMVCDSYVDLQSAIARATIDQSIRSRPDWSTSIDVLQDLNRHLSAFLSIVRQYIDHSKRAVNKIAGLFLETKFDLEGAFAHEYDGRLGYRVLEALRNVSQHAILPAHGFEFHGERSPDGEPQRRQSLRLKLSLRALHEECEFKATVLKELDFLSTTGDRLLLAPYIRDYISGIATVHERVRRQVFQFVEGWQKSVTEALAEACGNSPYQAATIVSNVQGEHGERVFTDPFDRLTTLRDRNPATAHTFQFDVKV